MILAGLCAEGTTRISEIGYVDRGYEGIEDKLNQLGATISRDQESEHDFPTLEGEPLEWGLAPGFRS